MASLNATTPLVEHTGVDYLMVTPSQYSAWLKFLVALRIAITVGGIIGNLLNLRTFMRMGLRECVTITFFNIAVSDLSFVYFDVINIGFTVFTIVTLDHDYGTRLTINGIDPFGLQAVASIASDTYIAASIFLITFLATQRSLCVLRPLHFKGTFTRYRTFVVVACIWSYTVVCNIVQLSAVRFQKVWDANNNMSKVVLVYASFHKYVRRWEEIVDQLVLTVICLVLVSGGILVMAYALKSSVKFRQKTTATTTTTLSDGESLKTESGKKAAKGGVSSHKERQVIVQVGIVSAFLLLAFSPAVCIQFAVLIQPSITMAKYRYFMRLYREIQRIFLVANASVNFLIYYNYNSKFREMCFRTT